MFEGLKTFRMQCRKHGIPVISNLKYFSGWKASLKSGASSLRDRQPWIIYKAIEFIKANLKSGHHVFEYGGGGSTLMFLDKGAKVFTVENSKDWMAVLSEKAAELKTKNWQGFFLEAQPGDLVSPPDFAEPSHYSSDDVPSYGKNYKAYVSKIDEFDDGYFDWVIVDGRSRPACVVHSIPKVKAGGFLVLDNTDRKYYLSKTEHLLKNNFEKIFGEYGPSPYSADFTHTTIWKKIK